MLDEPKRPTPGVFYWLPRCPACGVRLDNRPEECPRCGQEIDYGEDDKEEKA
jgi:rRNA maturation endonuclease Nob1